MKQLVAFLFLILMILDFVYEMVYESFDSGVEAVFVIAIPIIGIYLSWLVFTSKVK